MPPRLYDHQMLQKEADELWRQLIMRKAPDGRCARCGQVRSLQAAHNVSRRIAATRHDPACGLPLCGGCHLLIDSDGDAKRELFVQALGEAGYERLRLMKVAGGKTDLKLVILDLQQKLGPESGFAVIPRETSSVGDGWGWNDKSRSGA